MNAQVSKIFRSAQVYFPFLQDYRFQFQKNLRWLLNKTHEADFEALSKLPRSSNDLFLDIGSNRGEAVQSILMRRPDAKIIAFEPNPYLSDKLEKLYKNDNRVELHNVGLGNQPGTLDLYIPFYNNYMFDGLASFKEENARDWLRKRLYGFQSSKLKIAKMTCEVKRLDDLNLKPYFIKIDVQGFEYEVLMGARETIRSCEPILLIETPSEKETAFLQELGYEPFIYEQSNFVHGKNNMNVFFLPERIHAQMKPLQVPAFA